MVKGIGADIVEIDRITKSIAKESFLDRIFTKAEQNMYHGSNPQTLAGNFAAKEAIAKALGTGFKGCSPLEIEILRKTRTGEPYVILYSNARKIFDSMGGKNVFISISHSRDNAVAYALIEG